MVVEQIYLDEIEEGGLVRPVNVMLRFEGRTVGCLWIVGERKAVCCSPSALVLTTRFC